MNQEAQPRIVRRRLGRGRTPRPSPSPPPAIMEGRPMPPPQLKSPIPLYTTSRHSSRSSERYSTRSTLYRITNMTPPPDEPPLIPGTIELESIKDSKITGVSIYSAQAEVTRLFNINVKAGLNQLLVRGLPQVMDQDSFRVEGRGAATIHDVALSDMGPPRVQFSSEKLEELVLEKMRVQNAIKRTNESIEANKVYLASVHSRHLTTTELSDIVEAHELAAIKLDDRMIELEAQKKAVKEQIRALIDRPRPERGNYKKRLNMKASITVFADFEGEIEIVLIYVVKNASWKAGYDIRVDMQGIGKPIQMAYKGAITQSTGEDWNDVPLILETANPTFGLAVPTLHRWTLSVKKPTIYSRDTFERFSPRRRSPSPALYRRMPGRHMTESPSEPTVHHIGADVSSQGTVSATFSVPGLISIPSDGYSHNVTITALFLESTMSWLCVPKRDNKTHLKARIKNASEYTLMSGKANVYVDGSFISKTNVPLVSPEETFDCPLGLDPSVRVTYHPLSKKISKSGFYSKSTNYVYKQHITIFNTKTQKIEGFKVLDQFPVSEDSTITVKHVNPALVVPSAESAGVGGMNLSTSSNSINVKGVAPVKISQNVVAQWDGADEVESGDVPIDALGKDGKVAWICSIPAGAKLGLTLNWEVMTPAGAEVTGL